MIFAGKKRRELASRGFPKLTFTLVLMALFILSQTAICLAQPPEASPRRPAVDTGHIIGDTLARGLEFGLKPIYKGLSTICFWTFRTREPEHITEIKRQPPSLQ